MNLHGFCKYKAHVIAVSPFTGLCRNNFDVKLLGSDKFFPNFFRATLPRHAQTVGISVLFTAKCFCGANCYGERRVVIAMDKFPHLTQTYVSNCEPLKPKKNTNNLLVRDSNAHATSCFKAKKCPHTQARTCNNPCSKIILSNFRSSQIDVANVAIRFLKTGSAVNEPGQPFKYMLSSPVFEGPDPLTQIFADSPSQLLGAAMVFWYYAFMK